MASRRAVNGAGVSRGVTGRVGSAPPPKSSSRSVPTRGGVPSSRGVAAAGARGGPKAVSKTKMPPAKAAAAIVEGLNGRPEIDVSDLGIKAAAVEGEAAEKMAEEVVATEAKAEAAVGGGGMD